MDGPDVAGSRVAAVVLTHSAPRSLERCLTALDAQGTRPGAVFVTDNASDEPVDHLTERFGDVSVRRLPENLGPAGGYAAALTEFLATPFEWAWVMDDDCMPAPKALATQLAVATPTRVVLPTVQSPGSLAGARSHGWLGALIHRSVVEAVGVPRAELFWWTEDTEYLQWRIPEAGFEVVWTDEPVTSVSRARDDDAKPAWKYYYEARNQVYHRLYVQRPTTSPRPRPTPHHLRVSVRAWRAARSVARLTARIALRERAERARKLVAVACGARDGLFGRLGATVVPDSAHRPSVPQADASDPEPRAR